MNKRIAPWDQHKIHSGVTVHLPEKEWELEGTNTCDDIAYPIMVTIVRGTSGSESDHVGRIATWRQKIRREFIHQRLSGVTSVHTVHVRFGHVVIPDKWRKNHIATTMAIICISREERGN